MPCCVCAVLDDMHCWECVLTWHFGTGFWSNRCRPSMQALLSLKYGISVFRYDLTLLRCVETRRRQTQYMAMLRLWLWFEHTGSWGSHPSSCRQHVRHAILSAKQLMHQFGYFRCIISSLCHVLTSRVARSDQYHADFVHGQHGHQARVETLASVQTRRCKECMMLRMQLSMCE